MDQDQPAGEPRENPSDASTDMDQPAGESRENPSDASTDVDVPDQEREPIPLGDQEADNYQRNSADPYFVTEAEEGEAR